MNFPWTTVAIALGVIASVTALVVTGHANESTVTVLVGLIPGLIASGYAERTNRDVRNGVVQEKAKTGAAAALTETGVQPKIENLVQKVDSNSEVYAHSLALLLANLEPPQKTLPQIIAENPVKENPDGGQGV
jgi:uncharacterized membrane protein YjjP (DUF1212 family)